MLKKFSFMAILGLIILVSSNADLSAANNSGKVVFLKGSAKLIRSGSTITIRKGTAVLQGDTVVTSSGSTVIIRLVTGSKVKIKANSKLSFSRLSKSKATNLYLHRGGIFAKVTKLRGRQKFNVRSVSTLAGVRGTHFYMHTLKDNDIWLCVNEGNVEVGESGSKSRVIVKPGKGISVKQNENIEKPRAYKWTKKLNWKMSDDEGDVEDTVDLDGAYDILDRDYD